jgi:uncharacterized protein YndB with AHSA1/START domain
METKEFKVTINAPKEKVWNTLWNDSTYQQWTSVFAEGSRAESDWKKGSKILFLDGKGSGMVSVIAEKIPNEFMSFKHLGEVKDGLEDTTSEKISQWAGAFENYTLKTINGKTELTVDMDISNEFADYFVNTFPKALDKVKEIAEKN